jgi:xylulokinase
MTHEPVVLGLDVGTSALKAVAATRDGRVVFETSKPYPLHTPQPGWTEQDPTDWWAAATAACSEAVDAVGASAVTAIGLSGQMHGLVPLNEDGTPTHRAILWNDQRTGPQAAALAAAIPESEWIQRTGNPPITGFQLTKWAWLRDHAADAYHEAHTVLFPKDWIGFKLTGVPYAEPTDASGSNVLDLTTGTWAYDLIERAGLRADVFPRLVAPTATVGDVTATAADATGLLPGTPVVAGAGDNAAAAHALGLRSYGTQDGPSGSLSLGTSGVMFVPTSGAKPDPQGRVHLFGMADGGFAHLGVTQSAAGSLAWAEANLAGAGDTGERVERALKRPIGAGGCVFTPYLAGERSPYLNPDLRGAFHGLTLATGPDDMLRAVLEGVGFSLRDVAGVMPGGGPNHLWLTGGGGRSDAWAQWMADVLNVTLDRPSRTPGPAHGAAALAWEASGVQMQAPTSTQRFTPNPDVQPAIATAYTRFREHAPPLIRT